MAKNEMDQLSRWASEADALGMHYGDYVAKYHPPQPPPERYPQKKKGEKKCEYCGAIFVTEHKARKYCGKVCAASAREKQKREAAARLTGDSL